VTPPGAGANSKWITIAVRLEPDLARKIRKLSHKAEMTVSNWLRDAIVTKIARTSAPVAVKEVKPRVVKEVPDAAVKAPF
jgi:hypothetical protein